VYGVVLSCVLYYTVHFCQH